MNIQTKREKIRNVPSIEELRKSGFKVSIRHFRRFVDLRYRDETFVYMTKTAWEDMERCLYGWAIDSHGGWTVLDVRTLTGREVSVKYNVPQGHQFDRKRAIRACLGKLIKELGHE